jgi:hypothetical protein
MTQFTNEPLSYCWFSEVYCIPQDFFVTQVRRTVPARQDKGDSHRSKHFRDGRDTFAGRFTSRTAASGRTCRSNLSAIPTLMTGPTTS